VQISMPEADDRAVRAIAAEIERYVTAHPGAADTAEGIQRWWLSGHLADEPQAVLTEALEWLIARGLIAPATLPDGRVLYAAPRERRR
jgi:hypothetical protein